MQKEYGGLAAVLLCLPVVKASPAADHRHPAGAPAVTLKAA